MPGKSNARNGMVQRDRDKEGKGKDKDSHDASLSPCLPSSRRASLASAASSSTSGSNASASASASNPAAGLVSTSQYSLRSSTAKNRKMSTPGSPQQLHHNLSVPRPVSRATAAGGPTSAGYAGHAGYGTGAGTGGGAAGARDPTTRHSTPVLRKTPSTASMRDGSSDNVRRGGTLRTSSSMDKRSSIGSARSLGDDAAASRKVSGVTHPPHPRTSTTKPHIPSPAWKVAEEHFTKELALHKNRDLNSKTVVVMQDACYDHRFSRPNSTKSGLESVVERPERLQACALGISAAYVLLGERSSAGRYTPQEGLDVSKLPTPPFQIRRSTRSVALNSPAVTHVHGANWMDELTSMCQAAESKLASDGREIERPGDDQKPLHTGDLYLCPKSIDAFQGALGGVCDGVDAVFSTRTTRRAFVAVRPPGHHCSRDYPSGFCWLNNVHVGITHAAMNHGLTHAAIIDFDLHHGDGSQALAWQQNARAARAAKNAGLQDKTKIGYFSLHDIDSFPCEDGEFDKVRDASVCIENAHGQFVHNVHMASWKTEADFWALYEDRYAILLQKARTFLRHYTTTLQESNSSYPPKAAIFISAGFDASEYESPGMQRHSVNVPTGFYARFTSDIVRLSEEEDLGVDGRIISVLEGGYSDRALMSGVLSHLSGLTATEDRPVKEEEEEVEGDNKIEELSAQIKELAIAEDREPFRYHSEWWSTLCLEQLEVAVHGPSKKAPILKRQKTPPTYSSPTQASVAKAVVPPKDVTKRMATWLIVGDISPQEVDWCTAAKELRKLIIPTDREVRSYEYKELKAQAHIDKSRDTHTPTETHGMSLRDRKPKASSPDPTSRSASRLSTSKVRAPSRAGITTVRKSSLPEEQRLPESIQPTSIESKPSTRPVQGSRRTSAASSTQSDEVRDQRLRVKSQSQPSLNRAKSNISLVDHASTSKKDAPPVPPLSQTARKHASSSALKSHPSPTRTERPAKNVSAKASAESHTLKSKQSDDTKVDDLAKNVRLRLKLNGPKKEDDGKVEARPTMKIKKSIERTNENAHPTPTIRQKTHIDTPTVKHIKQLSHGQRALSQSKKVENLISRFNEAEPPRSPDAIDTDKFDESFYYRESSQSPEPPRSPPSVSASQTYSACSEASPRTVEEFPREEIRKFSVENVNKLPLFTADSPIPFGDGKRKAGGNE